MTRPKKDVDALMQRLREQTAAYARELGFPIGSVVEFKPDEQKREPAFRGKWVVTGVIHSMKRIELDNWPRKGRYTCVDADQLVPPQGQPA